MLTTLLLVLLKALLLAVAVLSTAAGFLLMMRKTLGYFAYRVGPVEVGPWGAFQPIADVVKMLFKEDIIPRDADKIVYRLAPIIAFTVALGVWVVIPWGPEESWGAMANPNAGVLVMNDVPPPKPGTVYQMWLIGEKGPTSAGTMDQQAVAPSTTAVLPDLGNSTALAFTVEPGTGSQRPTTPLIAKLALS
jgi:hypothetical protein